jgi:hypothetical protein
MKSVRLLLALAAEESWSIHHMSVKSAFLNGDLKEEVYIRQLPGFVIPGQVWHTMGCGKHRGHGMRQALRAWNEKLDVTLKRIGFHQSEHEHAMYRCGNSSSVLLVGV